MLYAFCHWPNEDSGEHANKIWNLSMGQFSSLCALESNSYQIEYQNELSESRIWNYASPKTDIIMNTAYTCK